jgi:hypothetical protein
MFQVNDASEACADEAGPWLGAPDWARDDARALDTRRQVGGRAVEYAQAVALYIRRWLSRAPHAHSAVVRRPEGGSHCSPVIKANPSTPPNSAGSRHGAGRRLAALQVARRCIDAPRTRARCCSSTCCIGLVQFARVLYGRRRTL